jgi:mono/diheme cytochrome c family protein
MIRKLVITAVVLGLIGLGAFWFLTMPRTVAAAHLPEHTADLANGERIFHAGGCVSCHAVPGATGDDKLILAGGLALNTPFGVFHAPNISPDAGNGIGGWSTADFVTAMKWGVAPGGAHLYPAFPYASYQRMTLEDIIDLKAYLDTLPASAERNKPHQLPFPFSIRRGLGLWQLLYVDGKTFAPDADASDLVNRGAYLVQGPGHCGECHTPRGFDGGPLAARTLTGGPAPEGTGSIPNITPHETGIGSWSEADIANFLETGFTPEFDSAGGAMAEVVRSMAMLPRDDLEAIAAYLKTVAPLPSAARSGS